MIEGGGLGVFKPEEIGPSDVQSHNGVIDVLVDDEAEAVARGAALPVVLPGAAGALGLRRPARAAPCRAREPAARLRRAHGDPRPGGHRLAAGTARRLRRRHDHRAGAHRGPADRPDRQQPAPPGRRDRRRRRRQGRALHAAVQRAWPADRVALRHARLHGRPRRRGAGAGAPCLPHVRRGGAPVGAVLHRGAAQGLRPGRAGDGGGRLRRAGLHRRLAHRRVRRDGPRRRGEARVSARSWKPPRPAPSATRCTRSWWRSSTRTARR